MRTKKILIHDLALFGFSAITALLLRENLSLTTTHILEAIPYILIGMPIAAFSFLTLGTHRGLWRHVSFSDTLRIVSSVVIAIAVTTFVIFSLNRLDGVSRTLPVLQIPLLVIFMLASRFYVRTFYSDTPTPHGLQSETSGDRESVLIVGVGKITELYLQCVRSLAADRFKIEGILDENANLKGRSIKFIEVLGRPEDLRDVFSTLTVHGVKIDRIVITKPFMSLSAESRETLVRYERLGAIKLDMFEERLGFTPPEEPASLASMATQSTPQETQAIQCLDRPSFLNGHCDRIKRAVDIAGSAALGIALFVPGLIVAMIVAYDVGLPVIFWQERPGKDGKPFRVLKFRTMRKGHDRYGNKVPDEERTSLIGRAIRRFRLDELPQLFHIFIGEMSFVGPRPLLVKDQPMHSQTRLAVRPGVTGWAQINGGNLISIEEKQALDMWYIHHASLWLDIKIIFLTLQTVVKGKRRPTRPQKQGCDPHGFGGISPH